MCTRSTSASITLAAIVSAVAGLSARIAVAAEPASYVLTGDLAEIQKKKTIRFLVPGSLDHLPREHDPRSAELALAEDFAKKLKLTPIFVPVAERDQMIAELEAGRGDVIVASMTVTKERAEQIAFTRPLRTVRELLVTRAGDAEVNRLEDLAGKAVLVRKSSSYAGTLAAAAKTVAGIIVQAASERDDTFDLLQKVARGEAKLTVADSDIFDAAKGFEPNIRAAFELSDKNQIAWGLRKTSKALKTSLDAFIVERALTAHKQDVYRADLAEIKKRRVLRVLTRNASNTFFLYRGEQLGFEYELAKDFARELDVRLEMLVAPSREALLDWLKEGRADLVAAGLTVTPERLKSVDFTMPYLEASELVVVATKNTTLKELTDLKGKKISVRKSSSYYETLVSLQPQYGYQIELLPEEMETEDILYDVGIGKLEASVADSGIFDIELTYSDHIRSLGPLGEPVKISWAVRKDQPELKKTADAFLKKIYRGVFYNITVKKYFKNPKSMRLASSDERSDREGQLSPYDELAKKWARQYELDWRLITSQMYQESHFDPSVRSWVGAMGLMQVMPKTAQELKIEDVVDPDSGIQAGVKLLARYAKMFDEPEVKEKDRLRFALAGYNCGPGHVHDARRIAKDLGLDPNRWFGNVEKAMLLLSEPKHAKRARHGYCRCSEPVKYVSEIQTRYDTYSNLVPVQ
jgi:membrane-bound lytic murein transglycosylase F